MTLLNTHLAGNMNRLITSRFRNFFTLMVLFGALISYSDSQAQLSINATGTPFTIDFDNTVSGVNNGQFTGSGFTPTPVAGQINSNAFSITGLSEGNLGFGGTRTTPLTDFTRGPSPGGVTTGGMYAFQVAASDYTLGFQPYGPTNADMVPGSIFLKIQNNTGIAANSILVQYDIWFYNDVPRITSLNVSHSRDDITYSTVPSINFQTPLVTNPVWQSTTKTLSIDLSAAPLASGNSYFIKWTSNDVSGFGTGRDELALNNIVVMINPSIENNSLVLEYIEQPDPITIGSTVDTPSEALEVFYFNIQDQGTTDFVPTNVQSLRIVPGTNNNVSWASQIQGVLLYDGLKFLTIQSSDVTDSYIDLTFPSGELLIDNGTIAPFALLIYLNNSEIIDGGILQFQIDTDAAGFSAYSSGSGFNSSFPLLFTSNNIEIDVTASELQFASQPVNTVTNVAMATDVSLEATDENGNRDLDFTDNIDLSSDGAMTIDPISIAAVSGLATWLETTDPIIHTAPGTGLTLTASSGLLTDAVSNTFDIIQSADQVDFTSYPSQGQRNQNVAPIIVSALKPDLTVDDSYAGNITISVATGSGIITGTLTKAAVDGVATFSDIKFNSTGDYTLLAAGQPYMTTATSGVIQIGQFFQGFTSCPPAGWLSVLISGNAWSCGSGYASVNGLGGSSATEAWYIAPSIDFSTLSNQVLSFDSWTSGTDDVHPKLQVIYSTDYSGSGNPYLASWSTPITFSPPAENAQVWTPSGLIDLSSITTSAYIAFKYTSSGTTAGAATEWRIDNVSITENGCSAPSTQASNLTFSGILSTQMTLNWDNGDGTGRLVLAKTGSAVNQNPSDGTDYAANADFTLGQNIGGGNIVVYKGNGNSVTVSGLLANMTYHYSVFEYNCDATNPTFNVASPAIGNQATNASDIIAQSGYAYSELTDYMGYAGSTNLTNPLDSRGVFGLTIQDGGTGLPTDALPTTLTSITINTNGSNAIRAAVLFDDTNAFIAEKTVNGIGEFTIDGFNYVVPDGTERNMELHITFENGVIDNEQIVFTVTNAIADPSGTVFANPDAGGAQSSTFGTDNTLRVVATALNFVQVPIFTIPVNSNFTIEVEALDSRSSRDLDKSLIVSRVQGTGLLTSASNPTLTQSTTPGTSQWSDLNYDTEEGGVQFRVDDGGSLFVETLLLNTRNTFATFSFTGAIGDEVTFSPDAPQPANMTISDISRVNITGSPLANAFNASSWPTGGLDDNSYFEIIISADAGFDFNLTGIQLDHITSSSGTVNWQVRSSLDNYGSNVGGIFATTGSGGWNPNFFVDFGTTFQSQTSVILRIYAYNSGGVSETWGIDNLSIFGTSTDIQAPSFATGFPQADSAKADGFHLYLNIDEPATVYYQILDYPSSIPSLIDFIANADGSIVVSTADSTYQEVISGLTIESGYDIYFLLDDGINQSALDESLKNVRTSDTDTQVSNPALVDQVPVQIIPSIADTPAEAVDVWSFVIRDYGTADGAPTNVTYMRILRGPGMTRPLSSVFAGVTLKDNLGNAIPILTQQVLPTEIIITLAPGVLTIPDNNFEKVTLGVYLRPTGIIDGTSVRFIINISLPPFSAFSYGTQFDTPFITGSAIISPLHTIDVDADRLSIFSYTNPPTVNKDKDIDLVVHATDENGNIDTGENTPVTVLLGQHLQPLGAIYADKPPPDLTQNLTAGVVTWGNIRYDTDDDIITLITSSTTLQDDTTGNIIIGSPQDLIVTTNITLTEDLSVRNVDIRSTGNLTINSGVTLTLDGDFNVDGVLNGSSGTVLFNRNNIQRILGSVGSANFYNITISNSSGSGVISELNINLINTLKLNANAKFDADGALNDKNFTLISTPTATARIDKMENGATLNGQIVWQRSLRTGPAGWRYIGTPIKGQSLANISDDVWIQGVAGNYPNAFTNIATYEEPKGTNGQAGFEGWTNFTSTANPVNDGIGMKLYLWNIDYATEQKIINKGYPNIGDGGDGTAGSGEVYVFPTPTVTPGAYDGGGWNFYANPYPSELDWDAVTKVNLSSQGVYIWNPNTQQYGTYASGISVGGVSRYVASGQGFFIKAASGAALSVSESSKSSASGNSFLRVADENVAKIHLKIISDQGREDETAIAFTEFATDGYDLSADAVKLSGGLVNLSSKVDNKLIAINVMGEARGVQSVKLNVEPYVYGDFSMRIPSMENFAEGEIIRLKDNYLNKTTLVNSNTNYRFKIDKNILQTYGGDRFELQFVSPVKFRFEEVEAKAGREFVMPVYADQLADIINAQVALGWDAEALTFVGVEDNGVANMSDFDLTKVESGKLYFNDSNESPVDLPDGTKLFSIRFKANNGEPQAQLRFEKQFIKITAIDDIDMPYSTEDITINILQNRFISGNVLTDNGVPVNEVNVLAAGTDEEIQKVTDNTGDYALDAFEQSIYTLSANKSDNLPLSNFVTTLDIIRSRRHILQIEKFTSPYQEIAADVNGSKSVSVIDLVEMRKVILGMQDGFISGLNWLFIPESIDLSQDPFSYTTSLDVSLEDQDINMNFKGVKVGDVDNSWTNSAGRTSEENIELNMENIRLENELIQIPVIVKDFKDISGYQFSITWDPTQLEYFGTSEQSLEGYFNEQLVNEGVLATMWDEFNGKSVALENGTTLFVLEFIAKDKNTKTIVDLNSKITEALAFDSKLNLMNIKSVAANVNLNELINGRLELFQNVPNPFDYQTQIKFKIAKKGLAQLSIINMLGEIIYLDEQNYDPGVYEISWDKGQAARSLKPGVYLYRLQSNGEEIVKKMLIE